MTPVKRDVLQYHHKSLSKSLPGRGTTELINDTLTDWGS